MRRLGLEELPSADALGDWLRRMGLGGVEALRQVNRELVASTLEAAPEELKLELGMEQMPCGQHEANAVFFAIGVLAYNLSLVLKAKLLPPEYRQASVATLRWKLYRLAGKLVRHARGWVLQIKADLEKWRLLESARVGCAGLGS